MKKRYQVSLNKEKMEELQALLKETGLPAGWLSREVDRMLPGLILVIRQAKLDEENRLKMTEAQAAARYAAIMSTSLMDLDK